MSKRTRVVAPEDAPDRKRLPVQTAEERAVTLVLAAGLLITATLTGRGSDPFRLPKELAFRAEAVVLLALGVFWFTAKRRTWAVGRRPEHFLALAIAGWAMLTTAVSTNRTLSADSLITVVAGAVIFMATSLAAQSASLIAIDVLMIGCCANAIIVILQELKIWTFLAPAPGIDKHFGTVGLLGNPNDVGTYLVAPEMAAVVLAVVSTGRRRWIYAGIAILLAGGIAASSTRAAIVALIAGLVVFSLRHSRRAAIIALAVALALGLVVASPRTTLGHSVRELASAAAEGDLQHLFSERLVPFLTAIDMARDHPLLGVGPGCFKYHYMRYRVGLFGRYPAAWTRGYPMNWGDVHNDHLQVAAETGLPGYALFVAAVALCVGGRKINPPTAGRAEFARALRWPLATIIVIVALGQFPLELAAPRLILLTLGALSLAWDEDHVAP